MQALLEGIALLSSELIIAIERATPLSGNISIDGGLSRNSYFCDFLAEALNRSVSVPASAELTGLGTAQLALIGAGLAAIDNLPQAPAPRRVARPQGKLSEACRARFADGLARCRNWR
jgi:glycerol kinase